MHKDPVCGMDIDPATAAGKSEYNGQTYYFCSLGYKKSFDKEPEKYIGKREHTHHHHQATCQDDKQPMEIRKPRPSISMFIFIA